MDTVMEEEVVGTWSDSFGTIFSMLLAILLIIFIWYCNKEPEKKKPSEEKSGKQKKECAEAVQKVHVPAAAPVKHTITVEEAGVVETHDDIKDDVKVDHPKDDMKVDDPKDDMKVDDPKDNGSSDDFVLVEEVGDEIDHTPNAEGPSGPTRYEIDVITGDVSGAGTDANVFIIIYGEHKDTGKIMLRTSITHKHPFERNHTDSFIINADNVGKIDKIRIGHDNKGGFAGWYLDTVLINVPTLNCKWTCPANRWLDKKESDKKIEIDVYPTLVEETYEEIIYEEVKAEDVDAVKDRIRALGDNSEDNKTTVSVTTVSDKDGGSHTEMVVEEVTTVTTSEEIEAHINVAKKDEDQEVTFEMVPEVESALDDFDVLCQDMEEECSADDSVDATLQVNADTLVKTVIESVVTSSLQNDFKLVGIGETVHDGFRLACVDDVTNFMETIEFTLKGHLCDSCALVDGCISRNGSKYEIDSDISIDCKYKLLAKVQMTTYIIDVETGDKSGAGTDANVFIILIGDRCSTGKIPLKESKTHKKMFERDQVDSFTVVSVDVGKILKIRISHDNKGGFAGWYLKNVVISNTTMDDKLTFVADRWLDLKEDDKKIEVDLYPLNSAAEPVCVPSQDDKLSHVVETEEITIQSSADLHDKDDFVYKLDKLDAEVHVDVAHEGGVHEISKEEGGAEVEITIESSADLHDEDESFLDKLDKLDTEVHVDITHGEEVHHITKEEEDATLSVETKTAISRSREDISVSDDDNGCKVYQEKEVKKVVKVETIEVTMDNAHVHPDVDVTPEKESDDEASLMYEVSVKTGDVSGAGTDSNVFVIIFGEKGDTGKIVLETPKGKSQKTFERNCEDTFIIEAADVGKVTNLRIGHDNKGSFSGWYLEMVVINIPEKNCKVTFQADRWLDTSEGDGKLEIDVKPSEEEECDQVCEMPVKVDVVTKNDTDKGTSESKVEFTADGDSPLVADNVVHHEHDVSADKSNDKTYEVHVQEIEVETMKYVIEVKTGDVRFAGTDANVFIILYGDRRCTTKLKLEESSTHKSKFERDHLDRFEVETLYVGNLEKVRIGHDNKGGLAGWHLEDVTVLAPSINAKWTCPANRWLDKDKGDGKLEVDLIAKKQ